MKDDKKEKSLIDELTDFIISSNKNEVTEQAIRERIYSSFFKKTKKVKK